MSGALVRVDTGCRLHIGFRNLSTDRDRLFGGIGFAIDRPNHSITAQPAVGVACRHDRVRRLADEVVSLFGLSGARIEMQSDIPRHVGYGSGTQLALGTYVAIAEAHNITPTVRRHASVLGRGGRSGVGVATFEHGGFVVDEGHPTASVLPDGSNQSGVPPIAHRDPVPQHWRIVLIRPLTRPGRSGSSEAASIERTIEGADAALAEDIEKCLEELVIPGLREKNIERFGRGITTIDSLNGEWFRSEQADRYRPPCDVLVRYLEDADSIYGWGQSSWGPLLYGVTTFEEVPDARALGYEALEGEGLQGHVDIVRPRNRGADVTELQPVSHRHQSITTDEVCQR